MGAGALLSARSAAPASLQTCFGLLQVDGDILLCELVSRFQGTKPTELLGRL